MTRTEIEEIVIELTEPYMVRYEPAKLTDRLVDDLQFDAVDKRDFVLDLEDEFHFDASDDEVAKLVTVEDVVAMVCGYT
jgi:acyl carrier protein